MTHDVLKRVTDRVIGRSRDTRADYIARMEDAARRGPDRGHLSCGNLAHGCAAFPAAEKTQLTDYATPNIGMVSAYNDMLSAHQPYERVPDLIREAVREAGGMAQFAGGVPAMCDGITQGQPGMELSLFSRDVIAMATAVSLSHNMFDGALCLGICDKIVPGLLMGALAFGHLPVIFVPSGPMTSGLPNPEKSAVRQRYAEGRVGRDELLAAESASYHSPGTCTFYGTANSNQMLMEIMGLHLPGASFINPGTPLRDALTKAAAKRVLQLTAQGNDFRPLYRVIDERAIINGVVGLLATGGSTNHTMHLVAIAGVAGIRLTWEDFSELSGITPLLARVYPNGVMDVNHFRDAGGVPFVIRTLLEAGLLHGDVTTVADGDGLWDYPRQPSLSDGALVWEPCPESSLDTSVLRPVADPFAPTGGIRLLQGNLGRGIIKVSAIKQEHLEIEAPAVVFNDQDELEAAFRAGELEKDFVAVIRFQGPKANGMPELHKLTPLLGSLMDRGFRVALLTDGRMSGASGKVPAAIQVSPEAVVGGLLGRLRNGDIIRIDAAKGELSCLTEASELNSREAEQPPPGHGYGTGRELFAGFRRLVSLPEHGASVVFGGESWEEAASLATEAPAPDSRENSNG